MRGRLRTVGGVALVVLGSLSIGLGALLLATEDDSEGAREGSHPAPGVRRRDLGIGLMMVLPAGATVDTVIPCGAGWSEDTRIGWPDGAFIALHRMDTGQLQHLPEYCGGARRAIRVDLRHGGHLCGVVDERVAGILYLEGRDRMTFECSASSGDSPGWCLPYLGTLRVDEE